MPELPHWRITATSRFVTSAHTGGTTWTCIADLHSSRNEDSRFPWRKNQQGTHPTGLITRRRGRPTMPTMTNMHALFPCALCSTRMAIPGNHFCTMCEAVALPALIPDDISALACRAHPGLSNPT
jgi:hypothetical protein